MTSCRAAQVVGPPFEVALHVTQLEERLRADVVEARHSGEADLEWDRDVALGLLRAPPARLGDDLDERRDRVRIGLDVEPGVGGEPGEEEDRRAREHDEGHPEGEGDETLDHFFCADERASAQEQRKCHSRSRRESWGHGAFRRARAGRSGARRAGVPRHRAPERTMQRRGEAGQAAPGGRREPPRRAGYFFR
jgi:hypothetical protein